MVAFLYLTIFKPFAVPLMQKLEVFNEITSLTLLYLTFAWVPAYVDDKETKKNIGWLFNSVMAVNITVHLFFMFQGVFRDIKTRCKKRKAGKKAKRRIDKEGKAKAGKGLKDSES